MIAISPLPVGRSANASVSVRTRRAAIPPRLAGKSAGVYGLRGRAEKCRRLQIRFELTYYEIHIVMIRTVRS